MVDVTDVVTDLGTKIFYSEVWDTVTPPELICSKKATYPSCLIIIKSRTYNLF